MHLQPYTRRSRSSSSLPTHAPRVTSTMPNNDQKENENTSHAIEEAIACTSFPEQQKKKTVAKSDVDKLNGMLQNFYTKTAYIIIQSRIPTNNTRMNRWFYLSMADTASLKNDLYFWHSKVNYPMSSNEPPCTLAIHIYLDTTHLSQETICKMMGEYMHQYRWYKAQNKKRIILESWFLLCKKSNYSSNTSNSFDLPGFYKQSIIFFRSLHSLARLLPGFSLYQRLQENDKLSLCYRLGTSMESYLNDELPPDQPFVTGICEKQSAVYEFSEMQTPIGILQLKVHYRVPFSMDDTYDSYGFDTNQRTIISPLPENINTHQCQTSQRQATISRSQSSPILHQIHGSSMLVGRTRIVPSLDYQDTSNQSHSNLAQRASNLCISPFKSPSLSPIPTSSTSTTTTTTIITNFTPMAEKSKSSTIHYGSSSRNAVFSSSFDKCKPKTTLSRQNSIEKPASKTTSDINAMEKQNNDLRKFMELIQQKPDLKLFQESRIPESISTTTTVIENNTQRDSTVWVPPVLGSSSLLNTSENDLSQRSKASLDYFSSRRYAHSDLSESMASTSSTMPRHRSYRRPSGSSFATDSSSLYDASLSSSSLYQSHRPAPPITTPPMIPTDTHSTNNDTLSRSPVIDQPSSSQKQQFPITPSKSSSQLSTMETLMEEDDAVVTREN